MARVCVVGNATRDLNRTSDQLFSERRPGGTLLYASLALHALGHEVAPIGHAPLRAYLWLRGTGMDTDGLRLAFPGTQFLNEYDGEERQQWARRGPVRAIHDAGVLDGAHGVLLGPVLSEVPAGLVVPDGPVSVLDLQGTVRTLDAPNLLAWKEVSLKNGVDQLPRTDLVRGTLEEARAVTGAQDPEACATALGELTGASAVITLGSQGAIGYDGALHTAVPEALDVVDPTGAGDVFDAGLLHGLLEGQGLGQALATGCAAAGWFLERDWDHDPLVRFGDREEVAERAARVEVR